MKKGCLVALVALSGCSLRGIVTKNLADTFSGPGTGYSSDDDPELVRDALPFTLKTMEQVVPEQPRHVGLLTALARGFTQYSYAYIEQQADLLEDKDVVGAKVIRVRARRLYLRAREYGLKGLEVRHPGMREALLAGATNPTARDKALATATKDDVELLYWIGASWALSIATSKDDMQLVGTLPVVEALMARALVLDESFDEGSIHEFYVTYDAGRAENEGGGPKKALEHLKRAQVLGKNKKLGSLVSYAEGVLVATQNKAEFTRLLKEEVLAYDVDKDPPHRLANIVAQRRAAWLLGRLADLFAQ